MGIGWTEILLVLAVALLVLGPTKLPGAAKSLGRAVREFKESFYGLEKDLTGDDSDTPIPDPEAPKSADTADFPSSDNQIDDKGRK